MSGKPGMFQGREANHNSANKYHGLDRYAHWYFVWMHNRIIRKAKKGRVLAVDFPRTRQGYIEFCKEIGPIPRDMKRPSVGRRNHKYGYIRGNIRWEEYTRNRNNGERVNEALEIIEDPPF